MKAIVLGVLMSFCLAVGAQAQQVVKAKLFTEKGYLQSEMESTMIGKSRALSERSQYLMQEPMVILVRVFNYSGESLVLGRDADWISFSVEPLANKTIVRQTSEPNLSHPFVLDNGLMATKRIDLTPHFDISQPGRYKITAVVKMAQYGEVAAEPLLVDVVGGTVLWDHEFGVPAAASGAPEVRRYQILQARQQDVQHLYVKVTDTYNSKTYGISALGQMVITHQPVQQIDRNNRLHVLHRSGRSYFTYTMVDYDGRVLMRLRYDQDGPPPVLRVTDGGDVLVSGGVRTKSPYDIDPLADEAEQKNQTP